MPDKDISIIVPVYNVENYLEQCLDSLICQTHENIEIICVNNMSTDTSWDILQKYAQCDTRIKLINLDEKGVSAARNAGIQAATAGYILFVDADDWIMQNACENLLKAAKSQDAQIVVSSFEPRPSINWIAFCGTSEAASFEDNPARAMFEHPAAYPFLHGKLFSRSLFADPTCRFPTEFALAEDLVFLFSVFPRANKISFISNTTAFYRCVRDDSCMGSSELKDDSLVKTHFLAIKKVLKMWYQAGYSKGFEKELSEWATTFICEHVQKLSYNDRLEFAPLWQQICEEYKFDDYRDMMYPPFVHQSDLMCQNALLYPNASLSIFLVPEANSACFESLTSLLNQAMPNFKIDVFCHNDNKKLHDTMQALAKTDQRIRIVLSDNVEESVCKAIRDCQTSFSIVCDANVIYDKRFLDVAVELASRYQFDVATFSNSLKSPDITQGVSNRDVLIDSCNSLMFDYGTLPAEGEVSAIADCIIVPPEELGCHLLSHSATLMADKVFSTEFLKSQLDAMKQVTQLSQVEQLAQSQHGQQGPHDLDERANSDASNSNSFNNNSNSFNSTLWFLSQACLLNAQSILPTGLSLLEIKNLHQINTPASNSNPNIFSTNGSAPKTNENFATHSAHATSQELCDLQLDTLLAAVIRIGERASLISCYIENNQLPENYIISLFNSSVIQYCNVADLAFSASDFLLVAKAVINNIHKTFNWQDSMLHYFNDMELLSKFNYIKQVAAEDKCEISPQAAMLCKIDTLTKQQNALIEKARHLSSHLRFHISMSEQLHYHKERSEQLDYHKARSEQLDYHKERSEQLDYHKERSEQLDYHKERSDRLDAQYQKNAELVASKKYKLGSALLYLPEKFVDKIREKKI